MEHVAVEFCCVFLRLLLYYIFVLNYNSITRVDRSVVKNWIYNYFIGSSRTTHTFLLFIFFVLCIQYTSILPVPYTVYTTIPYTVYFIIWYTAYRVYVPCTVYQHTIPCCRIWYTAYRVYHVHSMNTSTLYYHVV